MSYVVRNGPHHYLGESGYCEYVYKEATHFKTAKKARAAAEELRGNYAAAYRKVWEITYGLRWFKEGAAEDYYDGTAGHPGKTNTREDAIRYLTVEAARNAMGDWAGYSDGFGLKVVRFLREVKK